MALRKPPWFEGSLIRVWPFSFGHCIVYYPSTCASYYPFDNFKHFFMLVKKKTLLYFVGCYISCFQWTTKFMKIGTPRIIIRSQCINSFRFSSSFLSVVCMRAHILFTLFVFFANSDIQHILCFFSFFFLHLVYPMLPVSLDCPF